jgi:hypothetical protein
VTLSFTVVFCDVKLNYLKLKTNILSASIYLNSKERLYQIIDQSEMVMLGPPEKIDKISSDLEENTSQKKGLVVQYLV